MSDPQVVVGIDVSKAQLDVALRPTDACWHVNHDASGIAGLVERLRTVQPTLVVLEATGGLAVPVTGALAEAGLPVVVVNPLTTKTVAHPNLELTGTQRCAASLLSRTVWGYRDVSKAQKTMHRLSAIAMTMAVDPPYVCGQPHDGRASREKPSQNTLPEDDGARSSLAETPKKSASRGSLSLDKRGPSKEQLRRRDG
jgi:Transposase